MRDWKSHGFLREPQVCAWAWLPRKSSLRDSVDSGVNARPLEGLRFGVKDVIDVRGMPTQYGGTGMPDDLKLWDATAVAMLRAAGAQPIGKTVTAEFAFRKPGATRNPHQSEHTPGGSSSGSAASVAAGMVEFALGTQTGGSMMRPAAFCGVVGFKPSCGLVHRAGMLVTSESLDTIGWFSQDVRLSAQILSVFSGAESSPPQLPGKVFYAKDWPRSLEPEMAGELVRVRNRLALLGVEVHESVELSEQLDRLVHLHRTIMRYEFARGMLGVREAKAACLSATLRSAIDEGLTIDLATYMSAQNERRRRSEQMAELLAGDSLILAPSALGAAPVGIDDTGSSLPNLPWSLLGWPTLHLPTCKSTNGLPMGVQLVARQGLDGPLHAMAMALHPQLRTE